MKNKILHCLFVTAIALHLAVSAAEQPALNTITLISKDRRALQVLKDVAKLSKVIKHLIKDLPQEETKQIPLENINGKTLNILISLIELAYSMQNEPALERIQIIRNEIISILAKQSLNEWQNLIGAIEFLDIQALKGPLFDSVPSIIEKIHNKAWRKNREHIEATIARMHIPTEMKGLLAKYWYLKYGREGNFILCDIDYGFSIADLVAYNKLPGFTRHHQLLLDALRINDLTGLTLIPTIQSVTVLSFAGNKLFALPENIFNGFYQLEGINLNKNILTRLPKKIFQGLPNLAWIQLANNQLKKLPRKIFSQCDNLVALILDFNQLGKLHEHIFDGLSKLRCLRLSHNKLATLPKDIFAGLDNLEELNLSYNELTELRPGTLHPLIRLRTLFLDHNKLSAIPADIYNLPRTTDWTLSGNDISEHALNEAALAHVMSR